MHRRSQPLLFAAVLLLFGCALLSNPARALAQAEPSHEKQQEPLNVQVSPLAPLPETARVGQPLTLEFSIQHPASVELRPPESSTSSRYSIATQELVTTSSPENAPHQSKLSLTLLPLRAGTAQFDGLELVVTSATHPESKIALLTGEIKFISTLTADQTFKPALPPRAIEQEDYTPVKVALGIAGGLLLIGLVGFAVNAMKPEPLPPTPPAIDEVALEALQALQSQPPSSEPEVVSFYTHMSEIMREYLGKRYGFPGVEYTTAEILSAIPLAMLPPSLGMNEITRWLRSSDRVKFSTLRPSTEQSLADLRQAIAMVELTRPPKVEPLLEDSSEDPSDRANEANSIQSKTSDVIVENTTPQPASVEDAHQEDVVDDGEVSEVIDESENVDNVDELAEEEVEPPVVDALNSSLGSLSWDELSEMVDDMDDDELQEDREVQS